MRYFFLFFLACLEASASWGQAPGDAFFAPGQIHDIRFQFAQTGYFDSLKLNYDLDRYMRCDVTIDGVVYPLSGVKYKGNSSYNNEGRKKPFRIDLEEYVDSQEVDGMAKLVLNNAFKDPTLLREKLMLDFLNEHGITAPRASFARVYINDHYWGLYSIVEDVNKTFLKTRFDNKGGNLFKGDPRGKLIWEGPEPTMYYSDYELKTNETENDWSDLIGLLNALNNTPAAQLVDSLDRRLNLDSWFDYWAAHNLFVNLDSYIGSGHNYFLYHNKDTDKFEWITWDVNEAFGNFNMGMSLTNLKNLAPGFIPSPVNQRPIMNRLWANNNMKQRLADALCRLLQDFDNAWFDNRIDALANLIRPAVQADTLKFYSNALFEQNLSQDVNIGQGPGGGTVAGLKSFISARNAAMLQHLAPYGCSLSATETASTPSWQVDIWPNPARDILYIGQDAGETAMIEVYNASGQLVLSEMAESGVATMPVHALAPGIYSVQVRLANRFSTERVVILGE